MSTDEAVSDPAREARGALRTHVVAMGCKVNRIDAFARLAPAALDPVVPDVVLVQTCSVTDRADRDARRLIRRLRREHPVSRLVVAGCLAQRDPHALAAMDEVDLVVGHGVGGLPALLRLREDGLLPGKIAWRPASSFSETDGTVLATELEPDRSRAFLKLQDGCDRRCAYCVVPFLRGPERSAPLDAVEAEIRRLGGSGVGEVVLSGVHLSSYGGASGTLASLLRRLEDEPPACRVRLSSLEPMEAGPELLDLVCSSAVVVPHLHLPLQSGSDRVLRRMRRGISAARFRRLARRAAGRCPRLHLATDVIAGFPGETEADFEATLALLEELPLASLHVFPFSPRQGTRGAELHAREGVPCADVTRRARRLRELGEAKSLAFRRAAAGSIAPVVGLHGGRALTDHYLDVEVSGEPVAPGALARLRLSLDADGDALRGSVYKPDAPK